MNEIVILSGQSPFNHSRLNNWDGIEMKSRRPNKEARDSDSVKNLTTGFQLSGVQKSR